MGVTGSNAKTAMNQDLPKLIERVREHSSAALVVGFGVSTRDQFEFVADAGSREKAPLESL